VYINQFFEDLGMKKEENGLFYLPGEHIEHPLHNSYAKCCKIKSQRDIHFSKESTIILIDHNPGRDHQKQFALGP